MSKLKLAGSGCHVKPPWFIPKVCGDTPALAAGNSLVPFEKTLFGESLSVFEAKLPFDFICLHFLSDKTEDKGGGGGSRVGGG